MRETLSPVCWERCMDSSVLRCSGWLGSELPQGCCSVLSCQGSQVRHNHPCPAVPAAAESWPLLVPGDKELWMKEAGEAGRARKPPALSGNGAIWKLPPALEKPVFVMETCFNR